MKQAKAASCRHLAQEGPEGLGHALAQSLEVVPALEQKHEAAACTGALEMGFMQLQLSVAMLRALAGTHILSSHFPSKPDEPVNMQEPCRAYEGLPGALHIGRHRMAVNRRSAMWCAGRGGWCMCGHEGALGSCAPHRRSASALSCVARRWYVLLRIWSPASGSRQWAS